MFHVAILVHVIAVCFANQEEHMNREAQKALVQCVLAYREVKVNTIS